MKLIVERLAPTRNLSYEPYVQAFFDYQDGSSNALSLDGLSTEIVSVSAWREKFELRLEAVEWADRLDCALAYRTELFDADTVEQMSADFRRILRAVIDDPACPIGVVRADSGP